MKYGVPDVDLFQAVDLMERKNIAQVTNTIFAIGRTVIRNMLINLFAKLPIQTVILNIV